MKKLSLAISLLALAALLGCSNKQDVDALNYQLSMEQQQRIVMEKKIRELEKQLGQTDSSLREEISQSSQPVRFNQANIAEEMRSLKTELSRVQGTLEELNKRMQILEQSSTEDNQKLNTLTLREKEISQELLQITSQLGLNRAPVSPVKATEQEKHQDPADQPQPPAAQQEAETQYSSAQTLYKKALESFYARDYAKAQSMWGEFTNAFPDNPLTANAFFWHGEAAFQQQNYAQAVLSYQQVISKYKKCNKYAPALLKQGIAFFRLGKKEAGTIVLNDLIKQMPESFEASRAKTFLKNPN